MTHQKIRPHTKTPTASAAITEPIHRLNISWLCGVMPPCGQPKENASSIVHALVRPIVAAPSAMTPSTRVSTRRLVGAAAHRALEPTTSRASSSERQALSHQPPQPAGQGRFGDVGRLLDVPDAGGSGVGASAVTVS